MVVVVAKVLAAEAAVSLEQSGVTGTVKALEGGLAVFLLLVL